MKNNIVDNRKVAIYSRKSKFTGKGESIANQIEICKAKFNWNFEPGFAAAAFPISLPPWGRWISSKSLAILAKDG